VFRELTIEENLRAATFVHPAGAGERLDMVLAISPS